MSDLSRIEDLVLILQGVPNLLEVEKEALADAEAYLIDMGYWGDER